MSYPIVQLMFLLTDISPRPKLKLIREGYDSITVTTNIIYM